LEAAGTIVSLPPERLKRFSKVYKTGGLGESLSGAERRASIGKKWFEEEMQLDIWALGSESILKLCRAMIRGWLAAVVYHLIAMEHPYMGLSTKDCRSKSMSRQPTTMHRDPEMDNEKRKFLEIMDDIEEEDDEEADDYSNAKSTAKSWAEYRLQQGEKTLGGANTEEQNLANRTFEDVNIFKVSCYCLVVLRSELSDRTYLRASGHPRRTGMQLRFNVSLLLVVETNFRWLL
jgi:hypothetical protein